LARTALWLCLIGVLGGCASATLHVVHPLPAPAREVTLTLAPAPDVPMDQDQRSRLRSNLTSALAEKGVSVVPRPGPLSALVDGSIDHYDQGNRALRYLVGFGAGRGSIRSTWTVRDSAGSELGQCQIDGSISAGGFGGSFEDVLDKVGERLGVCLVGGE
jgi:hypothetical protein